MFTWFVFLLGLWLGAGVGTLVMAIMQINREEDYKR